MSIVSVSVCVCLCGQILLMHGVSKHKDQGAIKILLVALIFETDNYDHAHIEIFARKHMYIHIHCEVAYTRMYTINHTQADNVRIKFA